MTTILTSSLIQVCTNVNIAYNSVLTTLNLLYNNCVYIIIFFIVSSSPTNLSSIMQLANADISDLATSTFLKLKM